MPKIAFMGAGSTVFVKNIIGDCMCVPELSGSTIALYDVDRQRLQDSKLMLENINRNLQAKMTIEAYFGVDERKNAFRGSDFVFNAVQVGGYEPSTVIDFEIPKRYGLRQTIADTLGIGGIFRALRTVPVLLDFCHEMEAVCPNALLLNYSNPMSMLMMGVFRGSGVNAVGLCHSVQSCAGTLLRHCGLGEKYPNSTWKVAGINHQGWLLEIRDGQRDLYPEIITRLSELEFEGKLPEWDLVRLDMLKNLGYYITESSEHNAEYSPWYIKRNYPELIERFKIPLDEYPRRCREQIKDWNTMRDKVLHADQLEHQRSGEYGSHIVEAIIKNQPYTFGGNVMNSGLIPNLPTKACVEVMCIADGKGITPVYSGDLPEQCAAVNRTMINPQILTAEALLSGKKEHVYHAALLDPHTAAELSIDDIVKMCDELFAAHGDMIPLFK